MWHLIKDVTPHIPHMNSVWPAIQMMLLHDYLLPVEFVEFSFLKDRPGDLLPRLRLFCYTIPGNASECMSLILASFNMHIFGITDLDSSDVYTE